MLQELFVRQLHGVLLSSAKEWGQGPGDDVLIAIILMEHGNFEELNHGKTVVKQLQVQVAYKFYGSADFTRRY